jgi:hypothetical protein
LEPGLIERFPVKEDRVVSLFYDDDKTVGDEIASINDFGPVITTH